MVWPYFYEDGTLGISVRYQSFSCSIFIHQQTGSQLPAKSDLIEASHTDRTTFSPSARSDTDRPYRAILIVDTYARLSAECSVEGLERSII